MKTRIYTKIDYLNSLIANIQATKPGDTILLATMDFDVQFPVYDQLLSALTEASQRSVNVTFIVDAYKFLNGPILPPKARVKRHKNLQWLTLLKEAGVQVTICNQPILPLSFPFMGRSHLKCCIINDAAYLGGCNLDNPSLIDSMLEIHSRELADWLFAQFMLIVHSGSTQKAFRGKDITLTLSSGDKIIIDAGRRNQSSILEAAHALIDAANDYVWAACYYFPGGNTGFHLKKAVLRKCNVMLYYSNPKAHKNFGSVQRLYVWTQRLKLPSELFRGQLRPEAPMLHAKMLSSGHLAMIGSHNYVWQGVKFGTTEIAFVTQSPEIIKQIENSIHELVAPYR